MGKVRDPEQVSGAQLILAALAFVLAGAVVAAMVVFALQVNRDPKLVNWFGIATALGGALSFELCKYSCTVKSRHRQDVVARVVLTPAKKEELRGLLEEVASKRKLGGQLERAIELRARELIIEQERKELDRRAREVAEGFLGLAEKEDLLALDLEAKRSESAAEELYSLVEGAGESRRARALHLACIPVQALPAGGIVYSLAKMSLRAFERRETRRLRTELARDIADAGSPPDALGQERQSVASESDQAGSSAMK